MRDKAVEALTRQLVQSSVVLDVIRPQATVPGPPPAKAMPAPSYKTTDSVATREAFGAALAALGGVNPSVVVLDADVKNS